METSVAPGVGGNAEEEKKKSGRPRSGTTEQVRQFAAGTGTFTRAACREGLGLSAQQVDTAIDTLLRGKWLRKVGKATFEWMREKKAAREAPIEERIWHAMRINPSWSAADIAIQAGTTVNYVYKRLRAYRAEGYVARNGSRSVPGGTVRFWRITAKGRDHLVAPRVEEFVPDPVVMLAIKINRLVSSGMTRFPDEKEAARAACKELLAILEESP